MVKRRLSRQYFVDLFCGGCSIIERVRNPRIGNDIDSELIAMWKALTEDDWIPPTSISEYEYYRIKLHPEEYHPALTAFAAYVCSFGSKKWGGYAREGNGGERNYALAGYNQLMSQKRFLRGVEWSANDYRDVKIPNNSIVYCDIPYKDTQGYKDIIFDYDQFWFWARRQQHLGHTVFISSYEAPHHFKCIKEMNITMKLKREENERRVERLFVPR